MRSVASALCFLAVAASVGKCYVFSPSELAAKLRSLGVSDWDIPSIVCVAHNASNLKTDFVSDRKDIGYNYYGIFGIPDKLFAHKPCSHMTKQLSLDESIDDDLSCLMRTIKDGGYLTGDRNRNLGVFTPHDVDLSKCFDWWESLPPFIPQTEQFLTDKSLINVIENRTASASCRVECSAGLITNLLLLLLNLTLMGICAMGYFVLKQMRVNQLVMKFSEQPLI